MWPWRTDRQLLARVEQLEDRVRALVADWERAQLDLLEVSRRASNVIRSLARREASQEASHGPNGNGAGVTPLPPSVAARRNQHGLRHIVPEP